MEKTIASITKPKDEELKERLSAAREKLATLQIKVKEAKLPVLVLFEGFGAAGKGSVLSKIIKNMDPRFFHVETMDQPEPTELRKPFLYRYFKRIPENGQFTFMDGGWMEEIVRDRVHEQLDEEAFGKKICSIKRFERTLSDNGYTILKFFFYIDENEQKKRMEELLADENTAWRVSEEDLWQNKKHKKCSEVYQTYMEQTNQSYAPWYAIDAKSKKWAELQILERINQNIETALANSGRAVPILPNLFPLSPIPKLADVDLNKGLTEEEYQEKLEKLQKGCRNCTMCYIVRRFRLSSLMRAGMPPERVVISSGLLRLSMHAVMRFTRLQARSHTRKTGISCGASGPDCRRADTLQSSTVPGMDV